MSRRAEDVLSRLQITRETMTEILSGDETVSVAGAEAGAGEAEITLLLSVDRPSAASPPGAPPSGAPRCHRSQSACRDEI